LIRSLFIGFLILSALTAKGAGFQIVNNLNITPDMLPDLINAAVSACAEISGASSLNRDTIVEKDYSFGKHQKAIKSIKTSKSIKSGSLSFGDEFDDLPVHAWPAVLFDDPGLCGSVSIHVLVRVLSGESGRTSGLSPPYML